MVVTIVIVLAVVVIVLGTVAVFILGAGPRMSPKLTKPARKMVQDRAEQVKLDNRSKMNYSGSTYRASSYSKTPAPAKPVKRRESDSTYVAAESSDDFSGYVYDSPSYLDDNSSTNNYDYGSSSSSSYDSSSSSFD